LARGRDKAVHRHSLIRFRIFCKKLLAVVMLDLFFVRAALVPATTLPRHTSVGPLGLGQLIADVQAGVLAWMAKPSPAITEIRRLA
jgi:hypothetical protein